VSCESTVQGIARGGGNRKKTLAADENIAKLVADENIATLWKWNADTLDEYFDKPYQAIPNLGYNSNTKVGEAKVTIFYVTLFGMSVIIVEQMATIFVVRALFSSNYVGYMGCLLMTITERTWVKYTSSLQTVAMSTTHQVLDTVWMLI